MYSIDLNTNLAVERQAERVRAIRACGAPNQSEPASQAQFTITPSGHRLLAAQWIGALTVVLLVISVVLASSAWM